MTNVFADGVAEVNRVLQGHASGWRLTASADQVRHLYLFAMTYMGVGTRTHRMSVSHEMVVNDLAGAWHEVLAWVQSHGPAGDVQLAQVPLAAAIERSTTAFEAYRQALKKMDLLTPDIIEDFPADVSHASYAKPVPIIYGKIALDQDAGAHDVVWREHVTPFASLGRFAEAQTPTPEPVLGERRITLEDDD